MMNTHSRAPRRAVVTIVVVLCLLCTPLTALARRGERNFRRGLQHEAAQRWDQAAQEFALAVAASPSDTEYLLHYRRSVFNASQMFMQQGRALAERADYVGAYNAFRQAYGYDPVNELALSEMQRMLRLQREATGGGGTPGATITPTSYQEGTTGSITPRRRAQNEELPPARTEQVTNINYSNVEIDFVIRTLAERLGLNVVFDRELQAQASQRRVTVNLQNVTTAEALDYIFTSQNLFFQRLSRRTILVADQSKRPQYQQLVMRTFYLQNADPARVRELIMGTVQAPGRQIVAIPNVQTNSITVRDTPENVRLIGELIENVDKDRAAVVLDVSIYEVSRTDLQQLGLQIGTPGSDSTASTLLNIGGTTGLGVGGLANTVTGIPNALGVGLIIPPATLTAFQRNDRTRLIYRNQVHAFDDEETKLRSGQRVPFQSGVIPTFTTPSPAPGQGSNPIVTTGGYPIIQQEPTGLTLTFKPRVYPNLDVQVQMNIESREVFNPGTLTPTFTERSINGSARVQNNQTLMLASIAQDRQSNGRVGLPLLGLIPILGRLFSAPRRDNFQTDIVIAITPRVLRAPDVAPRDELMRPTGAMQTPLTDSLAYTMRQIDREEQLAAAGTTNSSRQVTANATTVTASPTTNNTTTTAAAATGMATNSSPLPPPASQNTATANPTGAVISNVSTTAAAMPPPPPPPPSSLPDAGSSYVPAPRMLMEGASRQTNTDATNNIAPSNMTTTSSSSPPVGEAELRLAIEQQQLRVGERRRLMVALVTDAPLNLAVASLRFDPRIVAVRSVSFTDMFVAANSTGAPTMSHSTDARGVLLVSVARAASASPMTGAGVFLIIEIEGLAAGTSQIAFVPEGVHLMASDGRSVRTVFTHSQVTVAQ